MEKERLEKGLKPAEAPASGTGAPPVTEAAKTSGPDASLSSKVSSDKTLNYAVLAGVVTLLGAVGWYMRSFSKKTEEAKRIFAHYKALDMPMSVETGWSGIRIKPMLPKERS